ncbi:FAD-dependent monooxygenase CTB5 [Paramyrothecium foliicola]|nr:FAD-dependent monooxygenase CTB5 [Paramyrothecium foliicola]
MQKPITNHNLIMAAANVIAELKDAFPAGQVVTGGDEKFSTLNQSYLSAVQGEVQPQAIFVPSSKEDVAKFISIVKPHAVNGELGFAIRGAGQQPAFKCNNIDGGITVDLRNLTGIQLEENDERVSIGAGETWGKVYTELQKKGLAVTGGRSGTNGIGGLALSGGLSFFSTREGFITDNVLEFEVVLASGDIVRANTQENSDLFVALRGGGNNFGIVTRYVFRTFKQGPFWGGYVYYFPPSFPGQIEAYVNELQKPDASEETHIMISAGYSSQFAQMDILCLNQVYHTKEGDNPELLQPFITMQPQIDQMKTTRVLDLEEATKEQTGSGSQNARVSYLNTTVKADVATLTAAYEAYTAALGPLKALNGLTTSLTLQAYPKSLLKKTAERGGNSLGIDAKDGPLMSILLLTFWQDKEDDAKIHDTFKGVIETIDQDAAKRGTSSSFKYLNYAAPFQDPISSYGEENKAKLQAVSKKFDPEGLFQKGVPGGWKLF